MGLLVRLSLTKSHIWNLGGPRAGWCLGSEGERNDAVSHRLPSGRTNDRVVMVLEISPWKPSHEEMVGVGQGCQRMASLPRWGWVQVVVPLGCARCMFGCFGSVIDVILPAPSAISAKKMFLWRLPVTSKH